MNYFQLQVFVHDEEVYCKNCYKKCNNTPILNGSETSSIKGEGNEACPRCQGKVFEAEKMKTKTHVWHKKCFTCCKVCMSLI